MPYTGDVEVGGPADVRELPGLTITTEVLVRAIESGRPSFTALAKAEPGDD